VLLTCALDLQRLLLDVPRLVVKQPERVLIPSLCLNRHAIRKVRLFLLQLIYILYCAYFAILIFKLMATLTMACPWCCWPGFRRTQGCHLSLPGPVPHCYVRRRAPETPTSSALCLSVRFPFFLSSQYLYLVIFCNLLKKCICLVGLFLKQTYLLIKYLKYYNKMNTKHQLLRKPTAKAPKSKVIGKHGYISKKAPRSRQRMKYVQSDSSSNESQSDKSYKPDEIVASEESRSIPSDQYSPEASQDSSH
jgi:hypothetical protein